MQQKTINIDEQQYERLVEKKEAGEIDSISEGIRNSLNGSQYGSSEFRTKADKLGTASGMFGLLLMSLTYFAPLSIRIVSLTPFFVSFIFFGAGYLYDYDGGVPFNA